MFRPGSNFLYMWSTTFACIVQTIVSSTKWIRFNWRRFSISKDRNKTTTVLQFEFYLDIDYAWEFLPPAICGKVMFYTCVSFCPGGRVWRRRACIVKGGVCREGGMCGEGVCMAKGGMWGKEGACMANGACIVKERACVMKGGCVWQRRGHGWRGGHCNGWYASYWNAFLWFLCPFTMSFL